MAVVYACLVVRSYFQAESDSDLAYASVMQSRAMLCEILAVKLLNRFASNHIVLVGVLMTRWNPLAGATYDIIDQVKISLGQEEDSDMDSPDSALEVRKPVVVLLCDLSILVDGDFNASQGISCLTHLTKSRERYLLWPNRI